MNTTRLPIHGRYEDQRVVVAYATVLDDDFTKTLQLRTWTLAGSGYPATGRKGKTLYLHRVIFERYGGVIPAGMLIDHIDRNPLNDVPDNLRLATKSLNAVNTGRRRTNKSGYVGITKAGKGQRWYARVTVNNLPIYLGCFKSPREAADAVNAAYRIHFPEVPIPNP